MWKYDCYMLLNAGINPLNYFVCTSALEGNTEYIVLQTWINRWVYSIIPTFRGKKIIIDIKLKTYGKTLRIFFSQLLPLPQNLFICF